MFDRWRKLLKAFHNEKKKQYDISKIPDIYDSAKYDAIHNAHLPLDLQPVYKVRYPMHAATLERSATAPYNGNISKPCFAACIYAESIQPAQAAPLLQPSVSAVSWPKLVLDSSSWSHVQPALAVAPCNIVFLYG